MLSIFKPKPDPLYVDEIGHFNYHKDSSDEYWELTSPYVDNLNCLNIDFCALEGDKNGPDAQALETLQNLLKTPNTLWQFTNSKFLSVACQDNNQISIDTVSVHFYIKSLTIKNKDSFEVGYHSSDADIFIELFIRNGIVDNIEKDYGCCDV